LGLFGAAAALCAVWVVIEMRVPNPLVRLNLLVGNRSLAANVVSALLGFSLFAAFTLIAGFVQAEPEAVGYGLGGSVLDVGLYMLPNTVTMLVFSSLAGRIAARLGVAYTLAVGSVFASLCYVWLALSNSHPYDMIAFSSIQGIGFGVAYAALGTLAVQHVPMDQSGIASGINSLVRTAGGSVAGAVTASVLAGRVIYGTDIPSLAAYELCFWIVSWGAALAAAVAVVHGLRHPRQPQSPAGPGATRGRGALTNGPRGMPYRDGPESKSGPERSRAWARNREDDMGAYAAAYERSIADPTRFWGLAARDVRWLVPPDRVLDDGAPPFYRWFTGGELNTCDNALDRHVEEGRGDQPALIYDSPVTGTQRTYTYRELTAMVARFAGALRA